MADDTRHSHELVVDSQQTVPQIMSTPPTPTSKAWRESRDTGFPEPFGDNFNTTLPHPDADLSPSACISQDDLSAEHAVKRRSLSMLSKHRRTVSHASSISTQGHAIHSVLSIVGSNIPGTPVADRPPGSDSSGASKMSISSARAHDAYGDVPARRRDSGAGLRRWFSSRRS